MAETSASERSPKRVHFIGIGGAGMSGIALVLHERGYAVTGSDLKTSRYIRQLERAGIEVHVGHEAQTIDAVDPDVVVISTAIPESNPELIRARERGIEVWHRAKMLSVLCHDRVTIAAAGTHGKTTTSSMCATMIDRMGLDPSFLIGGTVEGYDTNGRNGHGKYFVAEADESDSSFLYLDPDVVIVTNIEEDHMDHYGSLEEIYETFAKFMSSVGDDGAVCVCGDDGRLVELARSTGRRVVTYGMGDGVDVRCVPHDDPHAIESAFTVRFPDGGSQEVCIRSNPGRHNMLNATACMAVADILGLDLAEAARALSSFKGVRRRFTHVGDVRGITVIDDYGHHPTEIKATLSAAASLGYKHVVVVFQPHRYSRLQALQDDFVHAFGDADRLVLIDVFGAGEMPIPGVSSKTLADAIHADDPDKDVVYVDSRAKLYEHLSRTCEEGDLVITMGAGDVTGVGPDFIDYVRGEGN